VQDINESVSRLYRQDVQKAHFDVSAPIRHLGIFDCQSEPLTIEPIDDEPTAGSYC